MCALSQSFQWVCAFTYSPDCYSSHQKGHVFVRQYMRHFEKKIILFHFNLWTTTNIYKSRRSRGKNIQVLELKEQECSALSVVVFYPCKCFHLVHWKYLCQENCHQLSLLCQPRGGQWAVTHWLFSVGFPVKSMWVTPVKRWPKVPVAQYPL